ncbi:thioredoxin 1 [Fusarium proliferatum]|uniref:Thioredoxin domain-containing protein n=2 Tax=Fusarium oxysporum TaxID=5507 RepID=A0A420M9W9_FUSOX|nr:thioredoxin 1 [Fusarium proliferatum]RKK06711.1 hypothetical protein BFJ65_g18609 [Fusarium oxysporum f. sp. cepae]RKK63846.1 hypothetical protein BFJ69_g16867 [Fusarium oxysporum]RKK23697.1 hypothetical protein BFJ67_g17028 [Fusarium oxysporum f. sp. cepae]RKK26464.1 hypothetical protein BFJ66_g17105 [Fusarium oxysporum f. sp. cepae]
MAQHISSSSALDQLLASTTYVVVDFYADWCPPCRAIAPIFNSLATQHSLEGKLQFAKVNVDEVRQLAMTYGITAMPTFLFFKDGSQVEINSHTAICGADRQALVAAVEQMSKLVQSSDN